MQVEMTPTGHDVVANYSHVKISQCEWLGPLRQLISFRGLILSRAALTTPPAALPDSVGPCARATLNFTCS